ncbi:uncharacterized protein M421DRAFT_254897 [Didymella exigua CBS 183.55]|uniref:Uncharacterized protein n=1 Tax=Didymella exigua CBS 183.55 TaxID=1150837 RepID=A0A6A5S0A2_9PLEO|nr:uncharacterized protein M421DRAFT_254897 [Didymella exigua CBS 183.55]KAF1933010.1 hypothetical protein M421DRAFT_254897 [Didymella exigua CBS 183.55]
MLLHYLLIPVFVLSCILLRLAMHVEDYSLRTLAVREWRKYWYRAAQWATNALLGCSLFAELYLTCLLTLFALNDGADYRASFYISLGLALLGTSALAGIFTWARNSSQLYFSSEVQSCSKTKCVLWWFGCSIVWMVAVSFFWTDWVLAAKINLYSGYALVAGPNATIGEEHISLNWIAYQFACFAPTLAF